MRAGWIRILLFYMFVINQLHSMITFSVLNKFVGCLMIFLPFYQFRRVKGGEMASGTVPTSFTGLKSREKGLGFSKSMDFVRVSNLQRVMFRRARVLVIKNSNPGPETVELQPASEGSQLLGMFSAL